MKKIITLSAILLLWIVSFSQVSINASTTMGCRPLNVNLFYNGPLSTTWVWDFGDGSPTSSLQNPSHSYTTPGFYWVQMQAWNNSTYLGSANISITVQGVSDSLYVDVLDVCQGDKHVFALQTGSSNLQVNSVSWDFGDGNQLNNSNYYSTEHAYANPGTYTCTATGNSQCGTFTARRTVRVGNYTIPTTPPLFSVMNGEDSVCLGDEVEFWFTHSYSNYYLNFGDGHFTTTGNSHVYTSTGTYNPYIIFQNSCGDFQTWTTTINVVTNHNLQYAPNINNNTPSTCPGANVTFYPNGAFASYSWNFGDNTPADTNEIPIHTYSQLGTYTVTLTVANACGSTITATSTVSVVTSVPVVMPPILITDTLCVGDGMFYRTNANNEDPNLYHWEFGDGNESFTSRGSHEYAAPGTYTVTITATNLCSNTSSTTRTVWVSSTGFPHESEYDMFAGIPFQGSCPGDSVVIAFGPYGDSMTVSVLIDNIIPLNLTRNLVVENTRYVYEKRVFLIPGVHTIDYTITNGCGATFTPSVNYVVGNAIQAQADFFWDQSKPICQNQPVDFFAIGGSTFVWDFGDGSGTLVTNSPLSPVPHAYANAGTYTVKLTVFNGCGNSAETENTIVVPQSLINITTNSVASGCGLNNGTAIAIADGGHAPYTYVWSNGNSTFLADSLSSGIYVVTVTDQIGCSNFAIATVSDLQAPTIVVNTVLDASCYGSNNGAIDINLIGGNGPFTYQWSNGATSQDVNNLAAGPHEVTVTDANGCSASRSILVGQPPQVQVTAISFNTACGMNTGSATVNVSGNSGPYNYIWSNTANTPTIYNLNAGVYTVTVVDANGCIYTEQAVISETSGPIVKLDSISGTGCTNNLSSIYITAIPGTPPFTYLWSNGATTQDLLNVGTGTYSVVVTGSDNCRGIGYFEISKDTPEGQGICMVSVDTLTGMNQIIWEKDMNATDIAGYNIYKESSQSGLYYLVGYVDYDSLSLWVDPISNADVRSWRYKIAVLDDCGNESFWSPEHKTIHLNVNQGIGNVYNLIWDHYEGRSFMSYDIQRYNANTQQWSYLTTVPSTISSYTDVNPPAGTYSYRVDAVINACNPQVRLNPDYSTMAAINNTKSNIKNMSNNPPYGMGEEDPLGEFVLYPNPTTGDLSIICGISHGLGTVRIMNSIGALVLEAGWNPSIEKVKKMDVSSLPAGIYFVQVKVNDKMDVKKLIVR